MSSTSKLLLSALFPFIAQFELFLMGGGGVQICPYISPLNIKGEAIGIDHRIMNQQYTTLFPLNGTWVVERPVVWHANTQKKLGQVA